MLAKPVSASDIVARVEKTTHSELKNSQVVPMRPEKGYISLVRRRFCFDVLHLSHFCSCLKPLFSVYFTGDGACQGFLAPSPRG